MNKYIPGLARLNFRPTNDWTKKQAKNIYNNTNHSIANIIKYEDCINGMKSIPDNYVDLIIADPPFGINFSKKQSMYNRRKENIIDGYKEIEYQDYNSFTDQWINELPRLMKNTSAAYIFSGWTNLDAILNNLKKHKLYLINHIIWTYQFAVFTKRKFATSHYHILFVVKNLKKYYFNKIEHYPLDVWTIPRKYLPNQMKNSTKLPEEVVFRPIYFNSKPGDLILDPFMGNGTTAICCKLTYRYFIGFEMNPLMKPIIESNLQSIELGEKYTTHQSRLPSKEEIIKKYNLQSKLKTQGE